MVNEKLMELRIVTGKVRFHYVNLFEPRQSLEGYASKFGLCVLIAKENLETMWIKSSVFIWWLWITLLLGELLMRM